MTNRIKYKKIRPCVIQPNEEGVIEYMELSFKKTPYKGYFVSRCGKILTTRRLNPVVLDYSPNKKGYVRVGIVINGVVKSMALHRIVAETFLGLPENNLSEINHINGIKTDNRLENLEWVSHERNVHHSYEIGLSSKGSGRYNALIDENCAHAIKFLISIGMKSRVIAKAFRVTETHIAQIKRGRKWKHVSLTKIDTIGMFKPTAKNL